jgi:hypothetical protein
MFQHDEPGKPLDTSNRAFENLIGLSEWMRLGRGGDYRGVELFALQIRDVDLEVPKRILGQTDFIRRGPPGNVYGVGLPHHRDSCPGISPDPCSIKGTTRGIDIEPSENLGGGGIKTENDLDTAIRVLG